jgi:hypothetical protein
MVLLGWQQQQEQQQQQQQQQHNAAIASAVWCPSHSKRALDVIIAPIVTTPAQLLPQTANGRRVLSARRKRGRKVLAPASAPRSGGKPQ